MYLLDTNHCSRILANDAAVLRRLFELGDEPVATCVIVRGELRFMADHSGQREANHRAVDTLLARLDVYGVDDEVADWYGQLKAALLAHFGPQERGRRRRLTPQAIGVSENDLWIAAIAKRHAARVVSADADFERIQAITDLQVESWIAPSAT